jgi:hypothetical protein
MSGTLFNEVTYSLQGLIADISIGNIGLPELQRPFVWTNIKVRDLFDSMYRGFPVGYLLFWANGVSERYRQIGTDHKQKIPKLLVIDGQQRLTSLYSVIKNIPVKRENFSEELIKIGFNPIDETFVVADATTYRNPEYIPSIALAWSTDTNIFELADNYLDKLGKSREVSTEEKNHIRNAIQKLHNLINYPFTALELSFSLNEEQVAEIFVRINSKGTSLKQSDFILTLMSVFWDEGRTELESFCRESRKPSVVTSSPFNYFIQPDPDHLIRVNVALGFHRARLQHVYSILRGKDLDTGEFSEERREQQFAILKDSQSYTLNLQNWHEFLKTLIKAGYRSNRFITSKLGLLYSYAFYLIGKRDFGVDSYTLRNMIARWFFMVSLTGRYTGSPETQMEQDLLGLRSIRSAEDFVSLLDRVITDAFTEDYWNITLPNNLATSSPRSPSLFAYYAALNLLDARVLFSKMKASELLDPAIQAHKSSLERHHLFPAGYLAKLGIKERSDTNQIANYALVEWSDNIGISDASPAEYFPKYAERFTGDELESMRFWHALPQGWENMDYKQFLIERRRLIANVIRNGFNKFYE